MILLALLGAALYYSRLLPRNFLPRGLGPVAQRLEEAKVTGAVKAALRLNRLTKDGAIDVSTVDGVVTLRGEVGSDDARQSADQVAATRQLARYNTLVDEEDRRLVLHGRSRRGAEKRQAGVLGREAARGPIENGLQIRP